MALDVEYTIDILKGEIIVMEELITYDILEEDVIEQGFYK